MCERGSADEPRAVVSRESAQVLHELTELLPDQIHLAVPAGGCVIHKAVLLPADVEERTGFRVTTPLRTLLDVSASTTSTEQLEKAVKEALDRELVRRKRMLEAVERDHRLARLERILVEQG
jgi:hypothetical protein